MNTESRRLRNLLLMVFAVQFSLFAVIASEPFPLLHFSALITLYVIGNEAFWLFGLDQRADL